MTTKAELIPWFGLEHDPFGQIQSRADLWPTLDLRAAVHLLGYAVRYRECVAVLAEYGVGKTTTVAAALEELARDDDGLRVIPIWAEKSQLTIGQVVESCLTELGHDRLPRTDTARRRLLRQAWHQAAGQGERPLVVVDEAHRIRGVTLKAVKELHEQSRSLSGHPLFGLVLIGHRQLQALYGLEAPDLLARLEAHNILHLGRLLPMQGRAYVRHRLDAAGGAHLLSPENLERIDVRETAVKLNERMWSALRLAYEEGAQTLNAEHLEAAGLVPRPLLVAPTDAAAALTRALRADNDDGGKDADRNRTEAPAAG